MYIKNFKLLKKATDSDRFMLLSNKAKLLFVHSYINASELDGKINSYYLYYLAYDCNSSVTEELIENDFICEDEYGEKYISETWMNCNGCEINMYEEVVNNV